jgi:hypothetical protein
MKGTQQLRLRHVALPLSFCFPLDFVSFAPTEHSSSLLNLTPSAHPPPPTTPQTRKYSGVLLLKNLIILDSSTTVTVREILDIYPVPLHSMCVCAPLAATPASSRVGLRYHDTTLDVALNQFQANKSHIALVQVNINTDPDRDPYTLTSGVVTMEVGCPRARVFVSCPYVYYRI